ncbi:unnamed protein product [Parnassius apollo]|uniref:(apollo) hypothetical protein n=1 Tax=Parnassius apollo TaxID=110799 RepID=A0A8S3XJZ8_PARAO|nr:unnamed protein product [Parnassius apollo]
MDSDDEIEESSTWKGIPGTIILINALEDSSVISVAQEASCCLIRQYLRSSSSHIIGVTVYGTEQSKSVFNTSNVVDIFPLNVPTLDGYKKVRKANIESYGKAKELILSEALWHCSKIFKNCNKTLSSKTVIILTQLNNPPIEADREKTLKRVIDLAESYAEIKCINISMNNYQINPFYQKFLIEANKSKDYILPKAVWDSKVIETLMYTHSHRHLAVAKLCFEIGNGLSIGVGVYSLLKSSSQSNHKTSKLDKETNEIVESVTKTTKVAVGSGNLFPEDDNDIKEFKEVPLLKSELLFYQEYGGERIQFTEKEKKAIENPFGPPMIKLLGFKPARILCKEKWFLKTSYFIFPSESVIEGSTIAFKALHKACIEMDTVAICILCTRVNARPTIVALVPCTNPLDLDIEIGFDVIHIPFIENVRDIPTFDNTDQNIVVENAHKVLMKDILTSLQFDYKADMFENPKLQSEYRALEAKSLQEENMEPFVDTTKPNPEKFEDIRDELFEELFGPFGVLSTKRSKNENESCNNTKKVKLEDINEDELQEKIINKTVDSYTTNQLKNILKNKATSKPPAMTGLKKSQLVDLVYKHCK